MITYSKLGSTGRLGNQLFQLSAAISLALRNNDKYTFPHWEYEKYFNLHNCFTDNIRPTLTYKEPAFHYSKIPYENTQNEVLDLNGYFQSYKYFEDQQDIIHGLLTPNIGHGIKWDYTALHCRYGDYVNLPNHYTQLGTEYYQKAMSIINSKYYIIFSDDINRCKKQFTGNNIFFSENKNPVEDLSLGLSCANTIIANSTFSWMMGFLNKNPSKIVIAPEKWFGPKLPHNEKDLLPPTWIKI